MEPTRCLLLAAGPEAPGARQTLDRALAGPAPVRAMLSESGLLWAQDPRLQAAQAAGEASVSVCSVSARAQGWRPDSSPDWAAWSGLAVWLLAHETADEIWTVLP